MSDASVSFLFKAASVVSGTGNKSMQILKSHYLLRSRKISGPDLPEKYFSKEVRCQRCYIEWERESEILVHPIKLTKRQRRRIRCINKNRKSSANKDYLLHSNKLEKICTFCGYSMKTAAMNPNKSSNIVTTNNDCITKDTQVTYKELINKKESKPKNNEINVYCESKVAFCLKKQKNTLSNLIKVEPKIIKNNKKKKDKFAGLCRTAVIAATKLKEEKEKQNKLNLFLRPTSYENVDKL